MNKHRTKFGYKHLNKLYEQKKREEKCKVIFKKRFRLLSECLFDKRRSVYHIAKITYIQLTNVIFIYSE